MSDRAKIQTAAHAVVLGRVAINWSPLEELERLQASIGWSGGVGYCIRLTDKDRKRIADCIAFNRGNG